MGITEDLLAPIAEELERPQDTGEYTPITIPEAAARFQKPLPTLYGWYQRGHLKPRRWEKALVPGGQQPIFALDDVADLVENPPKVGRPRKTA